MGQYAQATSVSSDRSQQEIQSTLRRYGADQFMLGWSNNMAVIGFVINTRQVRFVLPLPNPDDREFTHTPSKGLRRTNPQRLEAYEQAVRQRWRALNLVIKAKLEAVESGIVDFDTEFLGQIVLPNGKTVADLVVPDVHKAYATGDMPALLADYGQASLEA